ncbi:hypothetical protein CDL15_Pgr026203 [Punica granatum]|uniref:Uncharacterized protein n=1 Tax=Punica granatum TaxID=22663 RepID=A0A218VRU0_PUNGR|nr:hypothetical protein CDL15_Pgr026203 [Punica granatum]
MASKADKSIDFESTPLQEAPATESQSTVGDDDRGRRLPRAASTTKAGAFPFNVRTKTTSKNTPRDEHFQATYTGASTVEVCANTTSASDVH